MATPRRLKTDRSLTATRDYLRGRTSLKRVVLLIDGRHGLKPDDKDVMDALDKAAVIYQLVLTKADKVKPTEIAATADDTRAAIAKRPAAHPEVIATSSETGLGIDSLGLKTRPWLRGRPLRTAREQTPPRPLAALETLGQAKTPPRRCPYPNLDREPVVVKYGGKAMATQKPPANSRRRRHLEARGFASVVVRRGPNRRMLDRGGRQSQFVDGCA